ncbi:MAG: CAP domain-containing protein [Chloroflexota bacterium]
MLSTQLIPISGQINSDPAVETDVVARLNAWRITEGVAPLKLNPELQTLAFEQAKYLVGLTELPHGGELHKDSQGNLPPQRAYSAKWPSYGISARTAVGENAAVGNAGFALRYWEHSEIHRKTALNPGYREVGVAAIRYHRDYMIIAVFGSRPDYLPAFVFPEEGDLYFTNEQYKFKSGGKWIQNVSKIELYDENGKPLLTKPLSYVNKIVLPPLTTENIKVVYESGTATTSYILNVRNDVVLLPHHQKAATVQLQPANPPSAASTAATTPTISAPIVAITPSLSAVVKGVPPTNTPRSRPAVFPTNTPRRATAVPTTSTPATVDATESPSTILYTDESPEILILYDDDALVIVNDTDEPADISDLKLRYQGRVLETSRWSKVSPVSLTGFPVGHCLMLEVTTADAFLPEACTSLRAVLSVSPDRLFWRQDKFEVLRGDKVVAVCDKEEPDEEDHCEISWN